MPASTYLANKLLDHQVGKTAFTMPVAYIALSTTAPTAAGTNVTEPVGSAYARVTTSGATWTAAASGATSNATVINFPQATGSWAAGANFTHVAIYDAPTAGNMLSYGVVSVPKSAEAGDTISIAVGELDLSIT